MMLSAVRFHARRGGELLDLEVGEPLFPGEVVQVRRVLAQGGSPPVEEEFRVLARCGVGKPALDDVRRVNSQLLILPILLVLATVQGVESPDLADGGLHVQRLGGEDDPRPGMARQDEVPDRRLHAALRGENLEQAWLRVRSNQGSPGVDGRTIDETRDYLREHWPSIREQLLNGTYKPQPVRRVELAKPDGGVRKLGIPPVLDRLIQQAILQVLQRRWDPTFSEHSYGFRPGRSAHQAVAQAQSYVAEGYEWVVDIELENLAEQLASGIFYFLYKQYSIKKMMCEDAVGR
jgi:hypothetical protein